MKQPKINIKDKYGKDWGIRNITSLNWDARGNLFVIEVDFMGGHKDLMLMYDYNNKGEFENIHGNLIGKIQ